MVATRRGTRVGSPPKKVNDEISESTVPTPSTRRTRNRSLMEEKHSQSEPDGDSRSDADKDNITAPSLPASPPKRETRRSTRHLNDQKQPDSTHEADVSESESCSSVASGVKAIPRTRRRTITKEKPQTPQKDDISDAESCSSAVSALCSQRATRSLRKRVKTPAACNPATNDDGDLSDAGSYSSVVSLSKVLDTRRITRSRRTPAMSTAKLDPSDPDSCSSSVSGLQGSVVRRSARNQKEKPTKPIPLSLEETTDTPSTPVSKRRRDLQSRTKAEPGKESLDSDECLSGPSTSPWRSRRLQAKSITVGESGSEAVHVDVCSFQDSPRTLRGKGSLCLSRTDSDSSNRAVPVTRARSKASVACDDTTGQEEKECKELEPTPLKCESAPVEEDLEEPVDATVDAQECTMIEATAADITLTLDQDESAESSLHGVEILETQSMPEADAPISNIAVTEIAEADPEKAVEEMAAAVAKDGDVAMENNEPEFVKQNLAVKTTNSDAAVADPAHVPTAVEGNVEVVCEKGVVVTCDADESVRAIVDETSILLNDAVNAELLSQTSDDLTTTEKASIGTAPRKEMISLLDSSADEDSPDEGLSADEEEAQGSQEAVGGISDDDDDDDVRCPDEGQQLVEAQSSGLFVIDTRPGLREDEKYYVDGEQGEDEEEDEDFVDEEEDDDDEDSQALFAPKRPLMQLSTSIDTGLKLKDLGGLYIGFDGKTKNVSGGLNALKGENKVDELMKKSVIVPGFEKKDAIPPLKESKHAAKLKRKAEREKTTGDGWFNMKAPELTEELKNDLKALKMRSAMDPKRFYKKNDREGFPKYFQVGKVVDSPVDFYSSRIPKKERKRTIVEELLADAEFRSNNKRKYQEIMTEKAAQMAGKIKKHKFHKKKTNK